MQSNFELNYGVLHWYQTILGALFDLQKLLIQDGAQYKETKISEIFIQQVALLPNINSNMKVDNCLSELTIGTLHII